MTARVLIVDDNADYRLLVTLALEVDPELEVVGEARNAEEALAQARSLRPDVVLLDLVMPGRDGLSIIQELRTLAPQCAIVVASAYPESELAALRHTGSVAFLSKAVPPSRLGPEIRVLLTVLAGVTDALVAAASLEADPKSASLARRFVDSTLQEWGCEEAADTVTLLVSELVTNAVIHAHSDLEVSVQLLKGRLRVDVTDHDEEMVKRRDAADTEVSGRGMDLVEALATAWGVDMRPGGKSVWFEVPMRAAGTDALR